MFEKEVPTSKRGKMTGFHDMHWVGPWRELIAGVIVLGSIPLLPSDVLHRHLKRTNGWCYYLHLQIHLAT